MLHLETCLLVAEADRVCIILLCLNRLFALDLAAIKIRLFIGWRVYWVFG